MTSINPNNKFDIDAVPSATNLDQAAFLTPDALMVYCESRLRGLDEQINTTFAKQRQANDDSKVLSTLSTKLQPPQQDPSTQKGAQDYLNQMAMDLDVAADHVSDPQVKKALHEQAALCRKEAGSVQGGITCARLKALGQDAVGNIQKDLNSGTELSMINLQSLMSQRQSSVQLITNMVQSLGDQMNKIVSNVGH